MMNVKINTFIILLLLVSANSLRKVKTLVDSLHTEKVKMDKEKAKKNKGKGKAKLKIEGESDFGDLSVYNDNEYDEFM